MCETINSKITFVGAGPANIFSILELISHNINPKDIILIERGNSSFKRNCPLPKLYGCQYCNNCSIAYGFGGAGMYSDGKLEVKRSQKFDAKLAEKVFKHMEKFGFELISEKDQNDVLKELFKIQNLLKATDLRIHSDFVSQHIGTDGIIEITKKIEKFLIKKGVNILFNELVCKIVYDKPSKTYNIYTFNTLKEKRVILSDIVVVGIGKSSQYKFKQIFNDFDLKNEVKPPIIGVRYEFPIKAMDKISKGILKDPMIYWKTPSGDEITTYCTCQKGHVVPYFTDNFLLLGGHSEKHGTGQVSNFGIAFIINSQEMYSTSEYSYSYAKLANSVGGNKPVIQTLKDFVMNTQHDKNKIHKTTLNSYIYGNLNFILPKMVSNFIKEFIQKLSVLDEQFQAADNILSAPVIEFVSPKLKLSVSFESDYRNLFFSGETSGQTYGIITSAGSGIQIAETIVSRVKN